MEEKKTHRLVEKPTMSTRSLADYMAASDQARRSVLRACKYRAIARIVQHDDAKLAVSKYMLNGSNEPHILVAEAEYIRNKLADDQFDKDCNDINADYVVRFSEVVENIQLPKGAYWLAGEPFAAKSINGVRVTFSPSLLVARPGRKNVTKRGALMLRYQKDTPLKPEIGAYQSATVYGLLEQYGVGNDEEVDRSICLTMDAQTGILHPAPSNAVTRFNNTKAACATISEAWDNIKPPPNAVL